MGDREQKKDITTTTEDKNYNGDIEINPYMEY